MCQMIKEAVKIEKDTGEIELWTLCSKVSTYMC